jgi:hypothetical protein
VRGQDDPPYPELARTRIRLLCDADYRHAYPAWRVTQPVADLIEWRRIADAAGLH